MRPQAAKILSQGQNLAWLINKLGSQMFICRLTLLQKYCSGYMQKGHCNWKCDYEMYLIVFMLDFYFHSGFNKTSTTTNNYIMHEIWCTCIWSVYETHNRCQTTKLSWQGGMKKSWEKKIINHVKEFLILHIVITHKNLHVINSN